MWRFTFMLGAVFFVSCLEEKGPDYDLVIARVNLLDVTGGQLQPDVNVYLDDGKIARIDTGEIQQRANVIEGNGKYLIPGLFDCHVHTTDYTADFPRLIHYGVTSVFIPGGSTCTNDYFKAMRDIGNQDSLPAPRVFHTSQHFTMEGRHPVKTYASSNWREGETVFFLRDTKQIEELVKEVAQYPIQGIKLTIEDGPMPPFVERIPQAFVDKTVAEAAKHGLEVFAHASDNTEFLMAVKGGAQNIIHFVGLDIEWNNPEHTAAVDALLQRDGSFVTTLMIYKSFMYPLNPGWLEDPLLNQAYQADDLKKLVTPEAVARAERLEERFKRNTGLTEVTVDNVYTAQVEDIRKLLDLEMNIVLGTDTGNAFNFHGYSLHEEMRILEAGGIDPATIIKMGTLNAAKMMHAEDSLGSIEPGKLADMILLNKNPLEMIANVADINLVIKNGVVQQRMR